MIKGAYLALLCIYLIAQNSLCVQYEVENANELLVGLKQQSEQAISDLDDTWDLSKQLLQQNIDSWQTALQAQTEECTLRTQDFDDVNAQINENSRFLEFISEKIKQDVDLMNSLYINRCQANRNYIEGLKNDKLLLSLIDFLRQAIQAKESLNLMQKRNAMKEIFKFVHLYKNKDFKSLLQMKATFTSTKKVQKQYVDEGQYEVNVDDSVQQRTAEEIGTGHIDDNKENITLDSYESGQRQDWAYYKQEVLGILDELEAEIKKKMATAQEDEINAGISAADFRYKLEAEVQVYDRALYDELMKSSKLQARQVKVTQAKDKCEKQLSEVESSHQASIDELATQTADYESRRQALVEQLELFEYVLELYSGNVASQGEDYSNRIDDYAADGSFEEGDYQAREVDQIEALDENKMQQQVPVF